MKLLSPGTLVVLVSALTFTLTPATVAAQDTFWGVSAEVTPQWKSMAVFDAVYGAEELDISGGDFRVGFVRGRTIGSEWGVSFVRKSLKEGGLIATADQTFAFQGDAGMVGVEVNRFAVFGTIRGRVQIGMIIGAGVASLRGTARTAQGEIVEAKEAFSLAGNSDIPVHPIGRLEFGGAAIVTAGFKIRVSGGLDWPGTAKLTIGGVYFFGER